MTNNANNACRLDLSYSAYARCSIDTSNAMCEYENISRQPQKHGHRLRERDKCHLANVCARLCVYMPARSSTHMHTKMQKRIRRLIKYNMYRYFLCNIVATTIVVILSFWAWGAQTQQHRRETEG